MQLLSTLTTYLAAIAFDAFGLPRFFSMTSCLVFWVLLTLMLSFALDSCQLPELQTLMASPVLILFVALLPSSLRLTVLLFLLLSFPTNRIPLFITSIYDSNERILAISLGLIKLTVLPERLHLKVTN